MPRERRYLEDIRDAAALAIEAVLDQPWPEDLPQP